MLQLLGMRAEEASQQLLPALAPAADALTRTSQQLSVWLAVLQEALAATERAQAAHAEAARLQVPSQRPNATYCLRHAIFTLHTRLLGPNPLHMMPWVILCVCCACVGGHRIHMLSLSRKPANIQHTINTLICWSTPAQNPSIACLLCRLRC